MRIHCFQHVSFETAASVLSWIQLHDHSLSYTFFFHDNPKLPDVHAYDCLVVLGGPLGVNDEENYPWLKMEKQCIQEAIQAGKKVIGFCLGAQLIAAACGSHVYTNREKEIGFFPVTFTDEILEHHLFDHFTKESIVFQWHGDTFDLPASALPLGSSEACYNQGFLMNDHILALQFHLEADSYLIESMLVNEGVELSENGAYIQNEEQIKEGMVYLQQNRQDLFILLDKFLESK